MKISFKLIDFTYNDGLKELIFNGQDKIGLSHSLKLKLGQIEYDDKIFDGIESSFFSICQLSRNLFYIYLNSERIQYDFARGIQRQNSEHLYIDVSSISESEFQKVASGLISFFRDIPDKFFCSDSIKSNFPELSSRKSVDRFGADIKIIIMDAEFRKLKRIEIEEDRIHKIQSDRKIARTCINCGEPLGFFQKLTGRILHKKCVKFIENSILQSSIIDTHSLPSDQTATMPSVQGLNKTAPQPSPASTKEFRHRGFKFVTDGLYCPLCDNDKNVRGIWYRDRESIGNQARQKMVVANLTNLGFKIADSDYSITILQGQGGVEELRPEVGGGFILWFESAKDVL